jgi:hypothetical protein
MTLLGGSTGLFTTSPRGALDINSSTQGLVPPRVALTSKIVSAPVINPQGGGLAGGTIVYNTATAGASPNNVVPGFYYWDTTTSAWLAVGNSATTNPISGFTHYLGEPFGGGVVFYLYKGSDGLEHGLIVSLTQSVLLQWQTNTATFFNATSSEDGTTNTASMNAAVCPAKTYIGTLGAGWYIPSMDEMGLLYYNRYNVQKTLRANANTLLSLFANYWTSTEVAGSDAFVFGFNSGSFFNNFKTNSHTVRGIKSF